MVCYWHSSFAHVSLRVRTLEWGDFKILTEHLEDDSCDEIISDDKDKFQINGETIFCEKSLKYHRPNPCESELNENIPSNCNGGSLKTPLNRKSFEQN